jgi:hypothetical protein
VTCTQFRVQPLCEFQVSYRFVVFLEQSCRRSGRNTTSHRFRRGQIAHGTMRVVPIVVLLPRMDLITGIGFDNRIRTPAFVRRFDRKLLFPNRTTDESTLRYFRLCVPKSSFVQIPRNKNFTTMKTFIYSGNYVDVLQYGVYIDCSRLLCARGALIAKSKCCQMVFCDSKRDNPTDSSVNK